MLDVLNTLSKLVQAKKQSKNLKKPVKQQTPQQPVPSAQDQAILSQKAQAEFALAKAKASELILEAKNEAFKIRQQVEEEARKKLERIDRTEGALQEKQKHLQDIEEQREKLLLEAESAKKETLTRLEKAAKLSTDEARESIMTAVRSQLTEKIAKEIRDAEEKIKKEADAKAQEILVDAMKHGATDYVAEFTVSIIKLPEEDMKGRIIGKEGRNIRSFETATGVDVDLDEEGVIRLSCFDPVRREIARVALLKLLKDGRVQPGRIEEVVLLVKKDIERIMFEEGQKLCHAVGVYNLPAPLIALLGRFKFRFSYGQNMITHTLEETKIGIAMAQEVGADVNVVRLGCLLHDIGKVIMDVEGSHVELGVDLLRKYKIPQNVIDCVAQHHEDTPFTSVESMLVYISDAISGGRPGARYENYEEYVKRLKDLEEIAKSHKGVIESFAFQAGRELRVVVDPGEVDDDTAIIMAEEIKDEIEKKLTYPGTVKITVVRELRTTQVAK